MASVYKIDRTNGRGQTRSTVYFRNPATGGKVCDGTYPKKIAGERVRLLLTQLDDPDFTNPKLGREPCRVYAEKWFAARPVMASTKKIRSYLDAQLLSAFGDVPLSRIDRFLVQEWIEGLVDPDDPDARTYAPESIHSFYATLWTIMKYAALDRHIPVSLIGKGTVNLPGKGLDTRVFLTLDQLEDLLAIVATRMPYWYPMIKLVAETTVDGLHILTRTLSRAAPMGPKPTQRALQYHPRSDRHSKVACWAIVFDLLGESAVMRQLVADDKIGFGINHKIVDFVNGKEKNLDLVICRPGDPADRKKRRPYTFVDLAGQWGVDLTAPQQLTLARFPTLTESSVGALLVAVEAKAAMTAHQKAQPRLYDELNSSHQIVHAASTQALLVPVRARELHGAAGRVQARRKFLALLEFVVQTHDVSTVNVAEDLDLKLRRRESAFD